jgi:hypothetical protein
VKEWGDQNARKLLQRHTELIAADSLEIFRTLPGTGFHRLSGDRKEQFACFGKHPFRLVFEVDHDPKPRKGDGSIDLNLVTHIRIIEVVDYHGG